MRRWGIVVVAGLAGAVSLLAASGAQAVTSEVSHDSGGHAATASSTWSADSSITADRVFSLSAAAADEEPAVSGDMHTWAGAEAVAKAGDVLTPGAYRATVIFRDLNGAASADRAASAAARVSVVAECAACFAAKSTSYDIAAATAVEGTVSRSSPSYVVDHDFEVREGGTVTIRVDATVSATTGVFLLGYPDPLLDVRGGASAAQLSGKIAYINVYPL